MDNADRSTIESFGDEWKRFDQSALDPGELERIFTEYFSVFPWADLPPNAEGFDMGCGTGRWAALAAKRVGLLHCIDPSQAIGVAQRNLSGLDNVRFYRAGVSDPVLKPNSQDFGYSLGVLHHIPDTAAGIRSCVRLLKPGAPLLLYLYYAFDNRPGWYRSIWKASNMLRVGLSRLPSPLKHAVTNSIAVLVYLPIATLARRLDVLGIDVGMVPLSYYRHHSFYTMRTDSRDRFGTPLEKRFTRDQIATMMEQAGLTDVAFSTAAPFWCAVGRKRRDAA